VLLNSNSRWRVSDPLARFARVSPSRGGDYARNVRALFSPSVRGRAAEGGRESLTRHLELELGNTPEGHGHLAFATVTTGVTHGYTLTRLRG
jgi:hypothetical protein